MEGFALFGWPRDVGQGWSLCLADPTEVVQASDLSEVIPALTRIEQACRSGLWAALALAYEAAPAFDPALRTRGPGDFPLLWAGLYRAPRPGPDPGQSGAYCASSWQPAIGQEQHASAVAVIRDLIRAGETYQVNYSIPFSCALRGDDLAWFRDLARAQRAAYSAYMDLGRFRVLSLSPELFFARRGRDVLARPMKGTAARGRFPAEDEALRAGLAACPKNRAENVMIVDLVRSDLGRVAEPGSVRAGDLYALEALPTVWQMTSTVRARLRRGVGLPEILAALFPCGSVTGAPKVRTMQIIRDLESEPRQAYCGAVGYVAPGGDCVFNVPIRTIVCDSATGRARFCVGGGVTHDSSAAGEYAECLAKMRFLSARQEEFRLLETLLLARGTYWLLEEHLRRLAGSAAHFGFALDPAAVRRALGEAARTRAQGRFRVRLLVDRGGSVEVQAAALDARPRPLRAGLAREPVRSDEPLLFHKTTRREVYEAALRSRPDCHDALLWNEQGELTESCLANLVVELRGALLTPAQECGLLAGVFRERLLARGIIAEARLPKEVLAESPRLWLINSVRGWQRAQLVLDKPRPRRI